MNVRVDPKWLRWRLKVRIVWAYWFHWLEYSEIQSNIMWNYVNVKLCNKKYLKSAAPGDEALRCNSDPSLWGV